MKKHFLKLLCFVFFLLIIIALCQSIPNFHPDKDYSSKTFFALDTVITVTIYEKDQYELLTLCEDFVKQKETLFSATNPESDIYHINHAKGNWTNVDPETILLLKEALSYCELSEGALDITILPVKDLWDFTSDSPALPDQDKIETALSKVDYTQIEINNSSVRLQKKDAMLDLGCIAKGYIADELKQYLIDQGVSSALLSLGGNIVTIGTKPDGSSFKIGIKEPFAQTANPITTVLASDSKNKTPKEYPCVVTSGIYERYFQIDKKIYHHILNSKTGYPVENQLASVTIMCDNSMKADALSTLCLLLGQEKAQTLIENTPDVNAIFVTRNKEVLHVSRD